jgi:hypothetical protein
MRLTRWFGAQSRTAQLAPGLGIWTATKATATFMQRQVEKRAVNLLLTLSINQ